MKLFKDTIQSKILKRIIKNNFGTLRNLSEEFDIEYDNCRLYIRILKDEKRLITSKARLNKNGSIGTPTYKLTKAGKLALKRL